MTTQRTFQQPAPLRWQDLIDAARHSLTPIPPATAASQAAAHRAISTAYYAMFHALKESLASTIIGPPASQFATEQWQRIYQNGNHTRIRDGLYNNRQQMSGNGAFFASEYHSLHNARIQADYNPQATFTEHDARVWIGRAEAAVQAFLQLPPDEKGAILVLTSFSGR